VIMMKLLQAINLTKKFPNKLAVNNISLTINQGELVALLGPNGAGKSTTLNMMIGVSQPTNGQIIFGEKSTNIKDYKTEIGVVFQGSVLDIVETARESKTRRCIGPFKGSFSLVFYNLC